MTFYLKKYMWLISLVAVAICSYFLARMTANLIAMQFEGAMAPPSYPASKKGEGPGELASSEREAFDPIAQRNIFDASILEAAPESEEEVEKEPVVSGDEAVPTSLKIKLISTFSVGQGTDDRSSCIIAGAQTAPQEVYTVNDEKQFAPDTQIVKILFDRVEFTHKGRLEYVQLEDFAQGVAMNVPPSRETDLPSPAGEGEREAGVEKEGESSYVIDRAEVDEAIANLDKLYTQIRAVPHFSEGRPNGLKLLSVRSGSIFSKLGLKRGDILQKINGMELDIKKGLEIFNQLKSETRLTIDLERRGGKQALEYEIR